jgi:hypothetical protein
VKVTPRLETEIDAIKEISSSILGETIANVRHSLTAAGGKLPTKKLMAETESVIN